MRRACRSLTRVIPFSEFPVEADICQTLAEGVRHGRNIVRSKRRCR
jgi:hypothetical protein